MAVVGRVQDLQARMLLVHCVWCQAVLKSHIPKKFVFFKSTALLTKFAEIENEIYSDAPFANVRPENIVDDDLRLALS